MNIKKGLNPCFNGRYSLSGELGSDGEGKAVS